MQEKNHFKIISVKKFIQSSDFLLIEKYFSDFCFDSFAVGWGWELNHIIFLFLLL